MAAKALWYVGNGPRRAARGGGRARRVPARCACARAFGAVSRGTERLVFDGRVPESEFERMRAPFMARQLSVSGQIRLRHRRAGGGGAAARPDRVRAASAPERFIVPADAAAVVPDGVPPQRAVLAANMETALNAVWDGAPGPADRIAVVGGGVVGLLVARLCARTAGRRGDGRRHRAGARRACAGARRALSRRPDAAPADCDLVFHASASAAGLATALRLAGEEATIVELSWYGAGEVAAPLGGASTAGGCGSCRARSARSRPRTGRAGRMHAGWRPRSRCSTIPRSMPCLRRRSTSTTCRRGCRPSWRADADARCPLIRYPGAD